MKFSYVLSALLLALSAAVWVDPAWAAKPAHAGGSGKGDSASAPVLSFDGTPATVDYGDPVTLSWASLEAKSCEASGAWSGRKPLDGTEQIGSVTADSTFVLTCKRKKHSVRQTVSVTVDPATMPPEPEPDPTPDPDPTPAPTVSLTADQATVPHQGTATLTWNSSDATSCYAGGGWSGGLALAGESTVGPITASNTYSVTCDNSAGSAYAAVAISIEDNSSGDVTSPGTIGDGRLDAIIENIRATYDAPALAVVVTRSGQMAEASATGLRSVDGTEQVTLNDQWHLGSLSKAITGTLAATQVEAGVIAWDTRVADVWPEWANSMHSQYANATLADLLTHQTGLPTDVWGIPSYSSVWDSASGTMQDKRRLWAEELLETPPEAASGTWYYGNAGYIVAGAMLEAATGMAFEDLLQIHLLDPLGMSMTGVGAPGPNQPHGHQTSGGGLVPVPPGSSADNPRAMAPATGLHTTLGDYGAFMLAHTDGAHGIDGVVSAGAFGYLHTAQVSNYAIGWGVYSGGTLAHWGTNTLWRAYVYVIPSLDVGILVAANANNTGTVNAVDTAMDLLRTRASATP